jgi:hypothetical protein
MSNDDKQDNTQLTIVQQPVKNLGGRPKGSRDKSSRISPFKKAQAKSLYLTGHLVDEIVTMTGIPDKELIIKWARAENWDDERTKVMTVSSSNMLESLLKSQLETFDGIRQIKEKSLEHIKIFDVDPDRKYSEVVNAYLAAVDLEYKMKTNTLHARFLSELANVLKKRIQDRNLLAQILDDLVEVYENYTQKSIMEPRKETADGN